MLLTLHQCAPCFGRGAFEPARTPPCRRPPYAQMAVERMQMNVIGSRELIREPQGSRPKPGGHGLPWEMQSKSERRRQKRAKARARAKARSARQPDTEQVTVVDGLKYVGTVPTDADIIAALGYLPRRPRDKEANRNGSTEGGA